jgi:hypothetical protein
MYFGFASAQENFEPVKNDTITLAQAYMNLYLTGTYFDTLSRDRISKILAFEKDEIGEIKDSLFIKKNNTLYQFTRALYFQNQTKLLSLTNKDFDRNMLRRLKSIFGQAIESYNSAGIEKYQTFEEGRNTLYEMINFNEESNNELKQEIWSLKNEFNSKFNEDIYPDFKRLFNRSKRTNRFEFDSLTYFAKLYDMPLSMAILENKGESSFRSFRSNYISPFYTADNKLELISRYMQLKYLATKRTRSPRSFDTDILYNSYYDFMERLEFEDDEFIKKELNPTVCKLLLSELMKKYPKKLDEKILEESFAFMAAPSKSEEVFYFFPNPAPKASARFSKANFKPELATLNQVDQFLKASLEQGGFKNQLHYYYDMDGFALTTTLEKFNVDGSAVPSDKRFVKDLGGEGKFSYFEIFKSIFFDVESEYRMFAFIIASKEASMSDAIMTVGFADEILKNSYDSLPEVLKDRALDNKTLSIFVYHFHQNDIGEVPELDLSGKISVQDHLNKAGIIQIIQ